MESILPSYSCNSSIRLENVFSNAEIDKLLELYQDFYNLNNKQYDNHEASVQPLPSPIELHKGFASILAGKGRIFRCLQEILGKGYQFLGSETINVGNDTHGPHRDTFYKHDIAKVLICINDRLPIKDSFGKKARSEFEEVLDGSFLVFPGSHNIETRGDGFSQVRTHWPLELKSEYKQTSDLIHLGDQKPDGSYYYPYEDAKARYCGFDKLTFKKGDVIIFSTRAIHALYPQRETHMMHFIGMLFIEDFNQGYNKHAFYYGFWQKIRTILTLEKIREAIQYIALPANEEVISKIMRNKDYPKVPTAKGIQAEEIINESKVYNTFYKLQFIHRCYSWMPRLVKKILLSKPIAKKYFYSLLDSANKDLDKHRNMMIKSAFETELLLSWLRITGKVTSKIKSIMKSVSLD